MRLRPALAAATAATVAVALGLTFGTAHASSHPVRTAVLPATAVHVAAPDTSCLPTESIRPSAALPDLADLNADNGMLQAIKRRGRLVVGTSQDTLLFSSRNAFTGVIEGFDVDQLKLVAKAIFGNPNAIQIKVIAYDKRIPDVADGTVDIVADTMTINCDRYKTIDFSTVYYDAGQKVLVAKGSRYKSIYDLGGQKVCAATGSTSLVNLTAIKPAVIPFGADTQAECLADFQENKVTAISTDDTILEGLAAQDPYAEVVGARFTDEPYGMGINQKDQPLVRLVNAVLEQERADGTWKALYKKWLGAKGGAIPDPPVAEYLTGPRP